MNSAAKPITRCLASLLFCFPLAALQPGRTISQYAHASWRHRDGQLPGMVFAIAQTADGNLWFGTDTGLLRFDGIRFVPWHPPAGQQRHAQ